MKRKLILTISEKKETKASGKTHLSELINSFLKKEGYDSVILISEKRQKKAIENLAQFHDVVIIDPAC